MELLGGGDRDDKHPIHVGALLKVRPNLQGFQWPVPLALRKDYIQLTEVFNMKPLCVAVALLGSIHSAFAQTALPKDGSCPSGYYASGQYCVPSSNESKQAMAKAGSCPSGYYSSGNYCVATSKDSKEAIAKKGSCPSGYFASGAYCLKQK